METTQIIIHLIPKVNKAVEELQEAYFINTGARISKRALIEQVLLQSVPKLQEKKQEFLNPVK